MRLALVLVLAACAGLASLVRARSAWPRGEADAGVWVRIASQAAEGWRYDQALKVAMPALQIALRTSLCRREYLDAISSITTRLAAMSDLDTASPGGAPRLIAIYQPGLDQITRQLQTLPRSDRVACSAQLAALPPLLTP